MIYTQNTIDLPPQITFDPYDGGDSGSILVCSVFLLNNDHLCEGRKLGGNAIYWVIDDIGIAISSNSTDPWFSNELMNTPEFIEIFSEWHNVGITKLG